MQIRDLLKGCAMRKTTDGELKGKSQREITKEKYVRPELVKKEKILGVTGSTPPPAS